MNEQSLTARQQGNIFQDSKSAEHGERGQTSGMSEIGLDNMIAVMSTGTAGGLSQIRMSDAVGTAEAIGNQSLLSFAEDRGRESGGISGAAAIMYANAPDLGGNFPENETDGFARDFSPAAIPEFYEGLPTAGYRDILR